MSSNSDPGQEPRCPTCDHPVRPGTAFCANCGTPVSEITNVAPAATSKDAGATEVFVPIGDAQPHTSQATQAERSPWASPDSQRYLPPNTTAGSTPVTPTGTNAEILPAHQDQGIRGLVLGTVALVLLAAVIALYAYDAWLSDSARATVEGWIPW